VRFVDVEIFVWLKCLVDFAEPFCALNPLNCSDEISNAPSNLEDEDLLGRRSRHVGLYARAPLLHGVNEPLKLRCQPLSLPRGRRYCNISPASRRPAPFDHGRWRENKIRPIFCAH
jgi:hypothetical protein